jgi:hypothetical protein
MLAGKLTAKWGRSGRDSQSYESYRVSNLALRPSPFMRFL